MAPIQCFMIGQIGKSAQWLRRYSRGDERVCFTEEHNGQPWKYPHEGWTRIEDAEGEPPSSSLPDAWPHDDPRWLAECERCGYHFQGDDEWQRFTLHLWAGKAVGTGGVYVLHENPRFGELRVPVGAMWRSDWNEPQWVGWDGISLSVMTPGGIWDIDCPSSDGGGWSRDGEPPNVTAHPSIHIVGRYHGWLRGGQLVEV